MLKLSVIFGKKPDGKLAILNNQCDKTVVRTSLTTKLTDPKPSGRPLRTTPGGNFDVGMKTRATSYRIEMANDPQPQQPKIASKKGILRFELASRRNSQFYDCLQNEVKTGTSVETKRSVTNGGR